MEDVVSIYLRKIYGSVIRCKFKVLTRERLIWITEKVSDDISVLVISDLREPLSEKALANVKDFMARGGDMVILGEYGRSENMNELTASLGVRFSDGVLACP